jgi:hypothetical protein
MQVTYCCRGLLLDELVAKVGGKGLYTNCNKYAVKISTGKSEEIDIAIKVVRMGGGWNWHGANPIKYHQT